MLKPLRVGHVVLNVKDQVASTKFYTEILGFEIAIDRPGFGTFMTCGRFHHDLALFQAADDAAPVTKGGLGLNHVALLVESWETLNEFYKSLIENGVEIDHTTNHSMTYSIYINDPDGNGIELFSNVQATPEEGLAEMRRPDRKNVALAFN
jgi:catechol 2,3-dioxygenase